MVRAFFAIASRATHSWLRSPEFFYEILYWRFSCRILRTLKKVLRIYLTKIVRPSPIFTLKIQIHVHHFTITFLGLLSHQRSREFPQRKIGPSAFSRNPLSKIVPHMHRFFRLADNGGLFLFMVTISLHCKGIISWTIELAIFYTWAYVHIVLSGVKRH